MHRFTEAYLPTTRDGSTGSAISHARARLEPDLAASITYDEDAAGLFDRAFGGWSRDADGLRHAGDVKVGSRMHHGRLSAACFCSG